jgi:hypothetical protein
MVLAPTGLMPARQALVERRDRDADRAHPVLVCHVAPGRNACHGRPFDPHGSARSSAIACSRDIAPDRPAATHSRWAAIVVSICACWMTSDGARRSTA